MRSRVLLPAPFGPRSRMVSPGAIDRLTRTIPGTTPNTRDTADSSTAGVTRGVVAASGAIAAFAAGPEPIRPSGYRRTRGLEGPNLGATEHDRRPRPPPGSGSAAQWTSQLRAGQILR
jgi:hypothetical protein